MTQYEIGNLAEKYRNMSNQKRFDGEKGRIYEMFAEWLDDNTFESDEFTEESDLWEEFCDVHDIEPCRKCFKDNSDDMMYPNGEYD